MTIIFDGKIINNKGKGTVTYWKGSQVYTGGFYLHNECIYRNGSGILVYPSGKTISGTWFVGHLVGKFCCFDESGDLSKNVFVPVEKARMRIPRGYSLSYDQYLDRFTSVNTSVCEQTLIKLNDLLFDLNECFSKKRDLASNPTLFMHL